MKKKPKDTKQNIQPESTEETVAHFKEADGFPLLNIEQRLQEALDAGFQLWNTDGGAKIFVGGLPGKPPEKKKG
jgi:hypothetical protein